jgi:leader peptidase (prepilin peptidase)/N-methyltransferase
MVFYLPLALIFLGSIPAGFAAAFVSGKLADGPHPPWIAMIAACALIGGWALFVMPSIALLAISCALGWTLLVLATVDALAFRLPDVVTLPMIVAGLEISWWLPDGDIIGHLIAAVAGMAVFYAIAVAYRRMRGQDGLGLGDMKLAGVAGAWLGWQALPYVVLLGCAAGLVWVGIATMRRGKAALSERIPFGVALCFAIWIVWLYGPPDVFGPLS